MENKKEKLKVAFFFGAGVEGKGNFNIETGYDYLKNSLFASIFIPEMLDALSSNFKSKKYFQNYSYRRSCIPSELLLRNFLMQKAIQDVRFFETHTNEISLLLTNEDWKNIKLNVKDEENADKYKIDKPKNTESDVVEKRKKSELKKEFLKIITGEIKKYSEILCPMFRDLFCGAENDGICSIDLNVGISGVLDSYFHTIINPVKYGNVKFSIIFNYYWACYFTIIKSVLEYLLRNGHQEVSQYFDETGQLNYEYVLTNIEQLTKTLYEPELEISIKGSYYDYIEKEFKKYDEQVEFSGVITTNYYRFASLISEKVIYLNGQLNLFEYPEELEVSNFAEDKINKQCIYFPFLFGQSLVKPIVDRNQIEAFGEYYNCLKNTDVLVVMGFNINEDDNHINSFLHHYIKQGKRLIIVNDQENFDVYKKLKCEKNEVEQCKVTYSNCDEIEVLHDNNKCIVKRIFKQIVSEIH